MQRFFTSNGRSTARTVIQSVIFGSLFVAVSVGAATTISTSISTTGNLTVTGTSGLTGLTTMVYASSTGQSLTGNLQVAGGLAVGSSVTNSLAGTILLSAQSSDPTGVTQGTFYYNSTSKVLKMYDGSAWFTVGTTTSGISLVGSRLQLGDLTTQYLTLGTTTQQGAGKSLVTLEATTTASIPLSLVAYASQTGDIFDVLDASSAKLFYIKSSGALFASSTLQVTDTLTTYGNTVLGNAVGDTITVAGTFTSTAATASTLPFASTTAITATTASTTNLIVGGDSTAGTFAGMIMGTCEITSRSLTATTTAGFACTGATNVTSAYKIFVTATSTLGNATTPFGFSVTAASSTANGTLGVQIANLTGADNTPDGTLNFWAVR